ncbi:hypothetical protein [Noviherbaspirillum agri]
MAAGSPSRLFGRVQPILNPLNAVDTGTAAPPVIDLKEVAGS